ncbi:MAG: TRAP transporter substrate-binding protein DctP [Deltaproteobacteria bacterium]|nr:TRAP transporter substrate-binding protein DctP [Deltaproteobacteria bacterium]
MKRNKLWMIFGSFSLILTLLFSLLVVDADAAPAQKPGQKITWVFATNPGPAANTWSFYPYPRFQKLLELRSGGRLVLDTKMGLFPVNEVVHAVSAGRADIGWERIPWVAGTFPQWDYALPFFWDNIFEYEAFLNDPRLIEIERKSYAEKGLVKIADIAVEALDGIWGKKAVATVDDFKGYKIRTSGLITTLAMKLLGASPLTIPTAEIMEALQRGTVDAIQTSRGWGLGFGLPDVCTHVSFWKFQSVFGGMLVVNKAKFDALPADLKKIALDTGREMQGQTIFGAKVEELEAEVGLKVSRMKVTQPTQAEINKARDLVRPTIDKWLELAGPQGKQILDIAAQYAGGAKVMMKK